MVKLPKVKTLVSSGGQNLRMNPFDFFLRLSLRDFFRVLCEKPIFQIIQFIIPDFSTPDFQLQGLKPPAHFGDDHPANKFIAKVELIQPLLLNKF